MLFDNLKKYLTPFIIICFLFIILAVFYLITDGNSWGFLVGILFIGIAFGLVVLDFIFKVILNRKFYVVIVQMSLLLIRTFVYLYNNKTLVLDFPKDFSSDYIVIAHGVEGEKELKVPNLLFRKRIVIPENGIILTSSSKNLVNYETVLRKKNLPESNKGTVLLLYGVELKREGRVYPCSVWKLSTPEGLFPTSEDREILIENMEKLLDEKLKN